MKHNKLFAVLLSLTVVLATLPVVTGTAEAEDKADNIAVQAATGWQPKPTRTVTSSNFPLTVSNGETVQINGTVNYTAATGKSPITIAANASAKIIINGSVTLNGANASGTTGATAAIYVPDSSTLTVYSAHDETLSTSTAAPQDTLTLKGGNAAAGSNGGNSVRTFLNTPIIKTYEWYTGAGGNGGGGAAAAIGGNGGKGGSGGASYKSPVVASVMPHGKDIQHDDDHRGAAGNQGSAGAQGAVPGKIYISGRLNLNAAGGSAAGGGNGGKGTAGYSNNVGKDDMIGGCGGGGGGGGGLAAPAIGAGGAGGSGGGSGGDLSSDHSGTVEGCGGGGGGGGWPNGGGGGGGGAECSDAENKNDNTSYGGDGGDGGAAGAAGNEGKPGHSTGTNGHGINKKGRYDAEPGSGGSGGGGISASAANGGSGGREKDNSYNGGTGGSGGNAVAKASWNTQSNLIFSTASKLNLSSPLSYNYGDGQGQGSMYSITPYIVYDLMDCKVTLADCTYPGEDNKATTTIASISYSSSTDRDGAAINGSKNIATNRASIIYTNNKHCSSGTATVTGTSDNSRATVMTNNAVVGSRSNLSFKINQAAINNVPISGNFTGAKQNVAIAVSVSTYRISSTAAYKNLRTLCKSSGATGTPTVKWSVTSGSGTFANANSSSTTFTPSTSGSVTIKVTLSGMNDFKDYSKTITFSTTKRDLDVPKLSTYAPHPRQDISVILPDDIGDNATIQWYTVSGSTTTAIAGATKATYTVQNADIGKKLEASVTPSASSNYNVKTVKEATRKAVEDHDYATQNHNGFCTICGEYQPATLVSVGTYKGYYNITNGGQLFWFAALVNNDHDHAEFDAQNTSANAVLSQNINLGNRDWTPIGEVKGVNNSSNYNTVEANAYKGIFSGTKTKKSISGLKITGAHLRPGFFGTVSNATLENFNVYGKITLPEENIYYDSPYNSVGGIAAKMDGGSISGVTSDIDIVNTDGQYKHVGGIIGEIQNTTTNVTKCMYKGEIHVINSDDCVGGIVGYSNQGARISYCANLGTVACVKGTAGSDPYSGGILGYVNNAMATVKNCYNYGDVGNGGEYYIGAIIGWCRNSNNQATRFADNYYLRMSAPAGIGSGSKTLSGSAAPTVKNKSAFASGEVCYLVNGKTSKDSNAIWRQNIDNNITPYDDYPLFDSAIVYYRSDGTYSNYKEDVQVDISWGAMSFKYTDGKWNPDEHSYDEGSWEPAADDANKITVTNNSNVAVNAGFSFTPVSNITDTLPDFTATISGENSLRLEKDGSGKNTTTALLTLTSGKPKKDITNEKLGTITIKITTVGGNS